MENGGNRKVNAIYEARLHDMSIKPNHHASGQVRERYAFCFIFVFFLHNFTQNPYNKYVSFPITGFHLKCRFIRDKYERRKYFNPDVLHRIVTVGDDSFLGNDSSDKEGFSDTGSNYSSSSAASRHPSEAARLRAENRRNRLPNSTNTSFSDTSNNKPTIVQIPPKVSNTASSVPPVQPIIDLLDFSSIPSTSSADFDPPPLPPSLQASPNLDLFKSLTVNEPSTSTSDTLASGDIFGDIYNRKTLATSSASDPFPPASTAAFATQTQEKKKMTSEEILAMFNASSSSSTVSNAPIHASMSTPNFAPNQVQSRFDFLNSIPIQNNIGSSSSSLTISHPTLHTHHSFSSSASQMGFQGSSSHSVPATYHPVNVLNQNSMSFSMTNPVSEPQYNMGYYSQSQGIASSLQQTSNLGGGMSFNAMPPVQPKVASQHFMASPPPTNVPPSIPALSSAHPNMTHSEQNHNSLMPMGGMASNFSIMGGVDSNTAAFTVMGGNITNGATKSNNASQFGALNTFR